MTMNGRHNDRCSFRSPSSDDGYCRCIREPHDNGDHRCHHGPLPAAPASDEDRQGASTAGSVDPYHRDLLRQIAERDALAPGDPFGSGCLGTSSATFADRWHVYVHYSTARVLVRDGWLRLVMAGSADDYPVYELTEAGRAIAQETRR